MVKDVLTCLRNSLDNTSVDSGKVSYVPGNQEFTMLKGIALLKKYIPDTDNIPDILKSMRCEQWKYNQSWAVFSLLIYYLERNMIAKQMIPICDYSIYDPNVAAAGIGNTVS